MNSKPDFVYIDGALETPMRFWESRRGRKNKIDEYFSSTVGFPGALRKNVRDIHEAYTLSRGRGPTWRIWVPLNARKLSFFCFLALRLVSRVDYSFC
jgi:hypothetical protein